MNISKPGEILIDFNYKASDRDWPDDFAHENGNYFNQCFVCKETFRGYKRRIVCKKCCGPITSNSEIYDNYR